MEVWGHGATSPTTAQDEVWHLDASTQVEWSPSSLEEDRKEVLHVVASTQLEGPPSVVITQTTLVEDISAAFRCYQETSLSISKFCIRAHYLAMVSLTFPFGVVDVCFF